MAGSAPALPRSISIFGVRVDDVTAAEALAWCERFATERGRIVVTPNPEIVMAARREPALRQALAHADLAIPDGGGLLLAARLWGQPLREQVRGSDLTDLLLARAAARGWRVFLLGGAAGVAEEATARIRARWPTISIVGTFAGSADETHDAETRAAVVAAGRVDVLLVAYGGSRQERWLARNLPALDVGVGLGVGGVLDFLAGRVRRAPLVARRAHAEWLWRLIVQPWRWRRQLRASLFFPLIISHAPAARQRVVSRES